MKEKLMPPLVLAAICIIVSGLLVFAYNLTYVDTTGVMTDKLEKACESVFGEGKYTIMTEIAYDSTTSVAKFGKAVAVIKDEKGNCLIEVVESGYEKDSIHLVIGFSKDSDDVKGIAIVGVIGDSPSQTAKVSAPEFLSKFLGLNSDTDFSKTDIITGATYSSKGVRNAVQQAVEVYSESKEAIFSE